MIFVESKPRTFDDIIGHRTVVTELRNYVLQRDGVRGIILHGPDGVGKHAVADVLANALLCDRPDKAGRPCGTCVACVAGVGPAKCVPGELDGDAFENLAVGETDNLFGRDVVIMDCADELPPVRFDRMLKRLEEPRFRAFFIFLASDPSKIRLAAQSRCRSHRLRPLDDLDALHFLCRLGDAGGKPELQQALVAAGRGLPGELTRLARLVSALDINERSEALVHLDLDWPGRIISQWRHILHNGFPLQRMIGEPRRALGSDKTWAERCRILLFCLHEGNDAIMPHAHPALQFFQREIKELRAVWFERVLAEGIPASERWQKLCSALIADDYEQAHCE